MRMTGIAFYAGWCCLTLFLDVEADVGLPLVPGGILDEDHDAMVARRYFRARHVYSFGAYIGFDPGGEIDGGYPFVEDRQCIEINLGAAVRFELHLEGKRRLNHSRLRWRIDDDDIRPAFDARAEQRVVGRPLRIA